MRPTTVSIVEDEKSYREWLVALTSASGFRCLGAHPNAEAALKNLPHEKPNIVLMDIHLSQQSGIHCVRELRQRCPQTRAIILTFDGASPQVFAALEAGAFGYLLKGISGAKLLEALKEVHEGGAPMSPEVAWHVMRFFHERGTAVREMEKLTRREEEVLELVSQGFQNKEIAAKLGCSERTVGVHLQNIYEKLHVNSRTEAAAKFLKK